MNRELDDCIGTYEKQIHKLKDELDTATFSYNELLKMYSDKCEENELLKSKIIDWRCNYGTK